MIKHFCDLCGAQAPSEPSKVSIFVKDGASITYMKDQELCESCNKSMAEWAASRIKK